MARRLGDMTVAVLAGGKSSRFGGDKALARLAGRSLLRRVVERFRGRCAELLLVVDRRDRFAAPAGVRVVVDRFPGSGPLGGALAALEESVSPVVACCAVDAPFLRPAHLARLRAAMGAGHGAAAFIRDGFLQTFPCLLRRDACLGPAHGILQAHVATPRTASGRAPRLLELLRAADPALVEVPARWRGSRDPLADLDTRDDLARARRRLSLRRSTARPLDRSRLRPSGFGGQASRSPRTLPLVRPTADLDTLHRLGVQAGLEPAHEHGERLGAWGAFEGRRLIGGIALERLRRRAVVTWLWVARGRRRQGIASRLLAALEAAARSLRIRTLFATARSPAFFLRHGFVPVPAGRARHDLLAPCDGCPQRGAECKPDAVSKRL